MCAFKQPEAASTSPNKSARATPGIALMSNLCVCVWRGRGASYCIFCQGSAQRYSASYMWHPSPAKGQTQCQRLILRAGKRSFTQFLVSPTGRDSMACRILTVPQEPQGGQLLVFGSSSGQGVLFCDSAGWRQRDLGSGPGPLFLAVWAGLVSLPL